MQQWERGNIDLDADIREYLPEGFLTKLQYENEKMILTTEHISLGYSSFITFGQCRKFKNLLTNPDYCNLVYTNRSKLYISVVGIELLGG